MFSIIIGYGKAEGARRPGVGPTSGLGGHNNHPIQSPHATRFRKFKRRELIKTCDRIDFPNEFDPVKISDVSEFIQKMAVKNEFRLSNDVISYIREVIKKPQIKSVERTENIEAASQSEEPQTKIIENEISADQAPEVTPINSVSE